MRDDHPFCEGFEAFSRMDASIKDEFFQTLLMNANLWITVLSPTGCIEIWNHAAEKITGYSASEVQGSNVIWKQLYPDPDYRKKVTKQINAALSERKSFTDFETIILTKSGERRIVSWNTRLVADKHGWVNGYITMVRDITEEVVMQNQFQTLLLNANAWIAFIDQKAQVRIWNKTAETISGYAADEVEGSNAIWKQLYPDPEYRAEVTGRIQEMLKSENTFDSFQSRILTKNGETKIISWNTQELTDVTGNIEGFIIIGLDVTENMRLFTRFKNLLMHANVWVSFIDPKARIQIWNPAAEAISGYSAEEVEGSNTIWKQLYPDPDYRAEITSLIRNTLEQENRLDKFESVIKTKDGEKKIISWSTKALKDSEGLLEGFVIIGLDVTDQRQMQNDIIGFIGETAMRLKNPVEVIRNNIYDLTSRIQSDEIEQEDLLLHLSIQMKDADQIIENLQALNTAISGAFQNLPEALVKFLEE